ncbi:MAG TPA: 30S ribosome-binding factor RbfA [Thermoanaerobaculia bacterium]|jgi:ribosome-binding factor A|nr:30S ribosome-binding factor RbfA [Thermoanaerobaculia bacterium]
MRKTRRTAKVGETIRDALVEVFRHDVQEPPLGFSSFTEVEVSPDLHYARVYVSGLKEDETRALVEKLQEARGRVRHALGRRIHLRYTPELDFRYDETTMRALRVETLLREVLPAETAAPALEDEENDER